MESNHEVALCVTCLVDQWMPEVGMASVRLLQMAGCQVNFPGGQTCCGQPFFNSGFQKEAARLARRTIEIFEPYEFVVLPSGSCTSMIRVEYPHLVAESPEWEDRAFGLAAKTFELSEFLVKVLGWQPAISADAPEVSYHDSCHMKRFLHLGTEARQLLIAAGCTLTEMTKPDRCCGFGGLFSVRLPEVSNAMTAEKMEQARATGAGLLITSDPGCLMQMRGLKTGGAPQVVHLAVVLERLAR